MQSFIKITKSTPLSLKNGTSGHIKVFEPSCIVEMKETLKEKDLPLEEVLKIINDITLEYIELASLTSSLTSVECP
jgi:hypothetical protein